MLLVQNNITAWLNRVPFLRLLIPFILGIVSYEYFGFFHFSSFCNIVLCIIAVVLLIIGFFCSKKNRITLWLFGFLAQTAFFVLGGALTAFQVRQWQQLPLDKPIVLIVAQVLDDPIVKPKTYKTCLHISQYKQQGDSSWHATNVKLLAYFSKKSNKVPELGQQIVAAIRPQNIEQFKGATFDYPQYLARQFIYQQVFIAPQKWSVLDSAPSSNIYIEAQRAQIKLLQVFESLGFEGEELAVIAALTVGYKNLIDTDTRQAFAKSGAMHILAVSGLHVGIIFWILSKVLFFMDKSRRMMMVKSILILLVIWTYSFLAGMAPSIERAAIMFSLLTIAQISARKYNIFNVLATSAFVILLINPYSVFDIGFQLSYLAIVGIVYFYPLIYNKIHVKYRIIDYLVWQTIASSIAALFLTLPLTMYYFGTLPTWSLLTNLIGIPLSFVITILIVAALAISPFWMWGAQLIGWLAERGTWLFNQSIHWVSQLPYSQLSCRLSALGIVIVFLLILALIVFIEEYTLRNNYKKMSVLTD